MKWAKALGVGLSSPRRPREGYSSTYIQGPKGQRTEERGVGAFSKDLGQIPTSRDVSQAHSIRVCRAPVTLIRVIVGASVQF